MSKFYLLSYNSLQAFGWALSLYVLATNFISTKSTNGAYASAGDLISLLQSTAFLEVIHSIIGIVPSGALYALMQWGGRTHFLLAIVRQIDEVQELPAVFIAFVAWSISEVIRYSHYALNGIGICPSWLTYLRYTAFIFLYPVGLALGESKHQDIHPVNYSLVGVCVINISCCAFHVVWLMYQALPFIKQEKLYANVFDHLPFSYYTFVEVVLVLYPFLWLKLYLHLFKQRRSKLGKKHHEKKH